MNEEKEEENQVQIDNPEEYREFLKDNINVIKMSNGETIVGLIRFDLMAKTKTNFIVFEQPRKVFTAYNEDLEIKKFGLSPLMEMGENTFVSINPMQVVARTKIDQDLIKMYIDSLDLQNESGNLVNDQSDLELIYQDDNHQYFKNPESINYANLIQELDDEDKILN